MADQELVELLQAGVVGWNQWRLMHPAVPLDLTQANLINTDLSGANLSRACLIGAELNFASLIAADLSGASLISAHLRNTNLSQANLSGVNFTQAQVLCTNFADALLTGACLKDWNPNQFTNFDGVEADYVFLDASEYSVGGLLRKFLDRRPHSGNFKPGEFAALFQQALDTLDLIFVDGIDWKAFFASFQKLRQQYGDADLNIQAIEKKGGAFVVRLEMLEEANKASIEKSAKAGYEQQLQLIEARYQTQLQLKDVEIESHKRESANMLEITKLLANKPITVEAKAVSSSDHLTTNLQGATIGNYANKLEGNASQNATQYITTAEVKTPAEAAKEIHDLLVQLAQDNPLATDDDRAEHLRNTLPPTRLQRSVELLQTAGEAAVESLPGGKVVTAVLKKVREQEDVQRKAQG